MGIGLDRLLRRRRQRNAPRRMRRPTHTPTAMPPMAPPLSLKGTNSIVSTTRHPGTLPIRRRRSRVITTTRATGIDPSQLMGESQTTKVYSLCRPGTVDNGVVYTKRLPCERRVRYIQRMCPRGETIILIQKCLQNDVSFGAVQGNGVAVIDLNCVDTVHWPNSPIYLHIRTCSTIRERAIVRCICIITLKPLVSQLISKPMRVTLTSKV